MKRILILLALCLAALTVCASAAQVEQEGAAEALHALGLFQGTSTTSDGVPVYELDAVPSRNQAVIMLVRLLGKEEEALAGDWEIPFTDVAKGSLSSSYIGYAYANDLTKGTTETTYSGTASITRNQYLLFLMRAMGYDYGAMTTAEAGEKAALLGLTDGTETGAFTRGDVALLSYRALDTFVAQDALDVQFGKRHAATLREVLGLGDSPRPENAPVPLEILTYDSREELDGAICRDQDYFGERESVDIPGGVVLHYVWGGLPHGTVHYLAAIYDDNTRISLPLPREDLFLNAAPQNLSYDADSGLVTYEARNSYGLNMGSNEPYTRAGNYRFVFDTAARTLTVTQLDQEIGDYVEDNNVLVLK